MRLAVRSIWTATTVVDISWAALEGAALLEVGALGHLGQLSVPAMTSAFEKIVK